MNDLPMPLEADDPEVVRAIRVAEQLPPAQQLEFIRTVYRYVYAYRRTGDPALLAVLVDSLAGAVTLYGSPEYGRALERLRAAAAKESADTPAAADAHQLLAAERERWAG
jgi:hypothetical protein